MKLLGEEFGRILTMRTDTDTGLTEVAFAPAAVRERGYVHGGAITTLVEGLWSEMCPDEGAWDFTIDFLTPIESASTSIRTKPSLDVGGLSVIGLDEGRIHFTSRVGRLPGLVVKDEAAAMKSNVDGCKADLRSAVDQEHFEAFRDAYRIRIDAVGDDAIDLSWHCAPGAGSGRSYAPLGALVDSAGLIVRLREADSHIGYTRSLGYRIFDAASISKGIHVHASLENNDKRHAILQVQLITCDATIAGSGQVVYRLSHAVIPTQQPHG